MSKITVKAKTERGFWRAGRHFTRDGVELDTSKLKKGDLEAIINEPNLVVIGVVEDTGKQAAAELAAKNKAAEARAAKARKGTSVALWDAAEARAKVALDGDAWSNLQEFERIERIEAELAADVAAVSGAGKQRKGNA